MSNLVIPRCKRCDRPMCGMLIDGDGYLCPECILTELHDLRARVDNRSSASTHSENDICG